MKPILERKLVPIWIVWESREGSEQIRSIDTTERIAKHHKIMLKNESECLDHKSRIWIEKAVLDHLFGWEMLQELLRGKGQEDYANEVLGVSEK